MSQLTPIVVMIISLSDTVHIVGSYRSQFNRIISKGSYEELVRKLRQEKAESTVRIERTSGVVAP